jgi:hypothetical protein
LAVDHSFESELEVTVSVLALTGTPACSSRSSGNAATRVVLVSFRRSSDGVVCYLGFALPSDFVVETSLQHCVFGAVGSSDHPRPYSHAVAWSFDLILSF